MFGKDGTIIYNHIRLSQMRKGKGVYNYVNINNDYMYYYIKEAGELTTKSFGYLDTEANYSFVYEPMERDISGYCRINVPLALTNIYV